MSPACPSISYFYPRPPRGGRPATTSLTSTHKGISIHALREEGDVLDQRFVYDARHISIHALREEGDTYGSTSDQASTLFLSTPSARRATRCRAYDNSIDEDFYPRPPRGGRRLLGGAAVVNDGISIHALREEGDAGRCRNTYLPGYFYPRPPRGGRLARFEFTCPACKFLSTPSARRATDGDISHYAVIEFLSTPSARRATSNNSFSIRFFLFLSTPSARRATIDQQAEIDSYLISIHALREEGDPA